MLVKAEGSLNLLSSHDHEAHRVRIAEILIAVLPQDPFGFFLDIIARIGFLDSGAGLQSLEKTQGCRAPQLIQQEDVGFGNNEITCHESAAALKQGGENRDGIFMMCVILVGQAPVSTKMSSGNISPSWNVHVWQDTGHGARRGLPSRTCQVRSDPSRGLLPPEGL